MTKKWNYIKDKVPENEEIGTIFKIQFYTSGGNLQERCYKIIEISGEVGLSKLEPNIISLPLISNWLNNYDIKICLKDKWRYITKNEYMAFL